MKSVTLTPARVNCVKGCKVEMRILIETIRILTGNTATVPARYGQLSKSRNGK